MSLLSTIEELKQYIAIDGNTNMATLQPYVEEAESLYLRDLLGEAFMAQLQAAYNAVNGDVAAIADANTKALFPYLQRTLSYYTLLLALPHLISHVGEMGVRIDRNDNSDAAPRWKEEKLQFHYLKNGDIHADKLLAFLEEKATALVYGIWFGSEQNTKRNGLLVNGTTVASRYINITNSRRVYLSLRPRVVEIETRYVPKLIGKPQYDELITQLKAGTLTTINEALITKLQPIISKRALYMALPFMRVQVLDNGIFLYSQTDEIFKGLISTDDDIKLLREQLSKGEFGFEADEEELRQYLLDNIDSYPLVQATGVYTSRPTPGPTWRPLDPEPNDKFFSV